MSRIKTIGASVIALAIGGSAALAADLPRNQAPPPAAAYTPTSAFNWTGPYAGLVGGYAWDGGNVGNGWLGGAYVGYNIHLEKNWGLGVEGDFTFTGKSSGTFSNPWNSTIRGRVGYAYDRFLFYGTGGVAFGDLKNTAGGGGETTKVGWTAGLGAEAVLAGNVTGRIEYRHTDLGSAFTAPATSVSNDLLVGVGVKF
jgi:outer membrane immunogenic protein